MYSFLTVTDLHLTPYRPVARTEEDRREWLATQLDKLEQVFSYARANSISTIICAGDVFDKHQFNNSVLFITSLIAFFNKYSDITFITICGNHDLKYNTISNLDQSLLSLFDATCPNFRVQQESLKVITGTGDIIFDFFQYGEVLKPKNKGDFSIAVLHENIFESTVPHFMQGYIPATLASELPGYNLYISGHNHQKFCARYSDFTVINGGSLLRLNTLQKDFKPSFWKVDITGLSPIITEIPLRIEPDRIDDTHILRGKNRALSQARMQEYLRMVKSASKEDYDFEANLLHKMERLKNSLYTPEKNVYTVLNEVYQEIQEE